MTMRALMMILLAVLAAGIYAGDSGKPDPQPVADSAALLLKKLDLAFIDTPLGELAKFMTDFSQVPAKVSVGGHDKPVTLEMKNVTLAEALRKIKDQAGCDYRVIKGVVHLATPEEWAAIDKGSAKFTEKKTGAAAAAAAAPTILTTKASKVTYTIDGVTYTLEELKEKRPELYKVLAPKEPPPDAKK